MTFVKLLLCTAASFSSVVWGMETSTRGATGTEDGQPLNQRQFSELPPELKLGEEPALDSINSQEEFDEYAACFHEQFYTFIENQLREGKIKFGIPETQSPDWQQNQEGSVAFLKKPGVECGKALESLLQNPLTIECGYALRLSERFLLRKLLGNYMDKDVSAKEGSQRLVLGEPFGAPITLYELSERDGTAWRPENLQFKREKSLETLSLGASLYIRNILGYQVLKDYDDPSAGENLFKIKNGRFVGFGEWLKDKEWPTLQDIFNHLIPEYRKVCLKLVTEEWINRLCNSWPQHFSPEKLNPYLEREKNRYEVMVELFPDLGKECFFPKNIKSIDSFFPVDQKDDQKEHVKFCFMPDPSLSDEDLKGVLDKVQIDMMGSVWNLYEKLDYKELKNFLEKAIEKEKLEEEWIKKWHEESSLLWRNFEIV